MSYIQSTIVAGVLGVVGAFAVFAASSSAEAAIVSGSTIGEVWLNAGPGINGSGGNGDCYTPNVTMGRGELLSTGGVSGRRISAYLFNSGGAGAPHKSVRVTGYDPGGVKLSSCNAIDNTKNATWVHQFYDTPGNECLNALYASVVCYTTTNGT
jgi:hypothetical protein